MGLQKIKIINICDKIILFSLYAIAYFLPISKAIIESLTILAIVCYLLKKILQWEDIPKTALNLAIFSYAIICISSILISSNPQISIRTFFSKTLQNIAFFFVVAETLNSRRRLRNFIFILLISSTLLGIDGIYQYFTHKDFIRNRPYYELELARIRATFPTANDFGCYLYSVMPFALVCFFDKYSKYKFKLFRFLFLGLSVLLFICLTLTISRGAWFSFLSITLFMSIWIRPLGIFLLLLGIFIAVTQQFYMPFLKERLKNFFSLDAGALERKTIWDAGWKMFISKPWVGLGLGTFMFNFDKFVAKGYLYGVPYAHNCYLQMAAEIGIIGLLSFLSIIILFFYRGIKLLNRNGKEKAFAWYVLLASLAAILGYCVQMGVDTILYSLDLGLLFWLLLGLGTAAMKNMELVPCKGNYY